MAVVQRNGKWVADYYDLTGKRKRRICKTKVLAVQVERQALSKRDNAEIFGAEYIEPILFEEFAKKYLEWNSKIF